MVLLVVLAADSILIILEHKYTRLVVFLVLTTGLEGAMFPWKRHRGWMQMRTTEFAWLTVLQEDWYVWEERDIAQPLWLRGFDFSQ